MRTRIKFSKLGFLRYISHLDLHRIWERTCRRAGLPLSYSQGFHPQPRISLAAALPLGFLGEEELVDIYFDEDMPEQRIVYQLQNVAPPGLHLLDIQTIDPRQPAVQTMVISAQYHVIFLDPIDMQLINEQISRLISAFSLPRQRRDRDYDLRPLIESLEIFFVNDRKEAGLKMQLSAQPSATGRPEEVLLEMGFQPQDTRITRSSLILKVN